jgi:uncharacterized membrane protein
MNLSLLSGQPLPILIHLATVIPAFFLGTWLIFFSKKGTRGHRALGVLYVALMTVTAFAAIFIRQVRPGHFSLLHLFIPLTFWSVFMAIWSARAGNIRGHRSAMLGLYFGGLVIAGALTFYPGRLMYRIFFGTAHPQQQSLVRK